MYGQSYRMCADVYLFFRSQLGEQFTEPTDAPDITAFRLVDMFTSVTDPLHKDYIIHTFGLNIRQVAHVDMDDIESYIQHTGRAGRDGQPSLAVVLRTKGSGRRILDHNIKEYGQNETFFCRRDVMIAVMDDYSHIDMAPIKLETTRGHTYLFIG